MAEPTTATESDQPEPETADLDRSATTVEATPDAEALVDRLTTRLDLWANDVDAALFLASIAIAHDEEPVPDAELGDERVEVGSLDEAIRSDGEADPLTLFAFLDDPERDVETVLEETLPGWIEAGANLVEPRLTGADAVQAPADLADLIDEAG